MRQGKTSKRTGCKSSSPLPLYRKRRCAAPAGAGYHKDIRKKQQEGNCKEIQIMDKLKVIITNDQKAVKIPAGLRLMLRLCCTAVLRM